MATVRTIEPGEGRVVLVVVRVIDDRSDSVGSDETSTVAANRSEFEDATAILGVHEIVELGYPTDTLGDVSTVELRERIIHAVRTYRPYALVSFDPYAMYGEDNLDHITVARAVDESFWTSQFDLHHPEQIDRVSAHAGELLAPHGCFERWYFGRRVVDVTDVIDITGALERNVAAGCCHRTMMLNFFNQLRLQAETGGWRLRASGRSTASAPPRSSGWSPSAACSACSTPSASGSEALGGFIRSSRRRQPARGLRRIPCGG